MPKQSSSQSGFTLIETLVAIFALTLLMSAGGGVLISTLDSKRAADIRLERLGKLEVLTAHLRADLAGAVPRLVEGEFAGSGFQSFYGGAPDRFDTVLSMVRDGWTNLDESADRSELLGVEYRFSEGALMRRLTTRPDRTRQTPRFETVLIEGLASIRIEFSIDGVSSDSWALTSSAGLPLMPDSVSLGLTFENGETLSQSFLVGGRS